MAHIHTRTHTQHALLTSLAPSGERAPERACEGLEAAAEALNSLVDIYSEDNMHTQAIKQLKLLPALARLLGGVGEQLQKHGPGLEPSLGGRLEEVLENTAAFIEYKKDHI